MKTAGNGTEVKHSCPHSDETCWIKKKRPAAKLNQSGYVQVLLPTLRARYN